MTSFEKTVKLACKPKAAPPKAKYLDPIIAATWSEDGAVHDVCKALSPRFREPNVIVVFKALIVLHTMIRNGATDNILQYLSSSDVLKLRNVSSGNWEGYQAPQNLQNYAKYLDTRIRAYRELKHDAIRVQSETNRDMRNSAAIDEELEETRGSRNKRSKNPPPPSSSSLGGGLQRSKTLAGRKLRVMTVEKGLLRETKIVQRMVDSLVDCRFYLDNLEDELNITALRMLVKDLLILFQACNEGVINVLEHYFEMSHIDAQEALTIYKHFCKQTEQVVEYLGVAKKLQNLLNVPIPNLRHAPVSLASSLEEYLNDPNFEQNRIEYKTQKEAAERNAKLGIRPSPKPVDKPASPKSADAGSSKTPDAGPKTPGQKALIDFFSAIETEQQTMFNPQTNSPTSTYFHNQAIQNPFQQQQMMTGVMLGAQAFGQPQLAAQPTGFLIPQQTAMPMGGTNPFGLQAQQQQQPQQPFQPFLAPQQTGFLQPQMTGANPFRQSMLFPHTTGTPFGGAPQSTNPFPVQSSQPQNPMQTSSPFQPQPSQPQPTGQPSFPFGNAFANAPSATASAAPTFAQPFAQPASNGSINNQSVPPRSATAPLTGPGKSASPPPAQPVKTHQTGSRNPFGQPVTTPPPVPKPPTLMELAMGISTQGQQQQPMQTGGFPSFGSFAASNSAQQPNGTGPSANGANPSGSSLMANVASSFAFDSSKPGGTQNQNQGSGSFSPLSSQPTSSTTTGSTFSDSLFSSLSSQPTGTTATTSSAGAPSISVSSAGSAPLQRQTTGFSGLKPFKPSSSFGAALLESLPPIPSQPSTPPASNPGSSITSQTTGFPGFSLNSQPTGLGSGLRPQATGALGGANPFRASMFSTDSNPTGGFGSTPSFLNSSSTPSFGGGAGGSTNKPFGLGGLGTNPTGATSAFSSGAFGSGSFGLSGGFGGLNGVTDPSKQQQPQQQQQSLI
ncbi:ANTH-domain-containing protein [Dichomitus squalens]|uniref:ANTH-domain-containing protein n=1 Tax=Dichomitus squalens TaxID=114155 RepID=A0A4Q9MT50_9APHY|nr:ANTH-domain-containing protein [Dichomitus squalens]